MAKNNNGVVHEQAISELINRVEWLEDERRKSAKKIVEIEQRVTLQNREISTRESASRSWSSSLSPQRRS